MFRNIRSWLLIGGLMLASPLFAESTISYTYDNLGRLNKVLHWNGTAVAYAYDASGNRSTVGVTDGTSVAVSAGNLTFGTVAAGAVAPTRTITLRNDGRLAMTLSGLTGLASPFSVTANSCTAIAAGATCTMRVLLTTSTVGTWSQLASTAGATVNLKLTASATVS